jgi:hypothetical protein
MHCTPRFRGFLRNDLKWISPAGCQRSQDEDCVPSAPALSRSNRSNRDFTTLWCWIVIVPPWPRHTSRGRSACRAVKKSGVFHPFYFLRSLRLNRPRSLSPFRHKRNQIILVAQTPRSHSAYGLRPNCVAARSVRPSSPSGTPALGSGLFRHVGILEVYRRTSQCPPLSGPIRST